MLIRTQKPVNSTTFVLTGNSVKGVATFVDQGPNHLLIGALNQGSNGEAAVDYTNDGNAQPRVQAGASTQSTMSEIRYGANSSDLLIEDTTDPASHTTYDLTALSAPTHIGVQDGTPAVDANARNHNISYIDEADAPSSDDTPLGPNSEQALEYSNDGREVAYFRSYTISDGTYAKEGEELGANPNSSVGAEYSKSDRHYNSSSLGSRTLSANAYMVQVSATQLGSESKTPQDYEPATYDYGRVNASTAGSSTVYAGHHGPLDQQAESLYLHSPAANTYGDVDVQNQALDILVFDNYVGAPARNSTNLVDVDLLSATELPMPNFIPNVWNNLSNTQYGGIVTLAAELAANQIPIGGGSAGYTPLYRFTEFDGKGPGSY